MALETFSQDVSHIEARLLVIKGNSILKWSRNHIYKAEYAFRLFSQQNICWYSSWDTRKVMGMSFASVVQG